MSSVAFNRRSLFLALVLGFGLLSLVITGCGGDAKAKSADISISDANDGGDVTVPLGRKLIVTLDSNHTTGFAWSIKQDGAPVLASAGPSEYMDLPAGSPPGRGSVEKFTFNAQSAGTQTVLLTYARSSEPSIPAGRTFTVKVTVSK